MNGKIHHLWRAADREGEVLEPFVTKIRDKAAALNSIKKTLKGIIRITLANEHGSL